MLNEIEIESLKAEFVKWLDEEQCIGCCEENVVRTADPVQGFIDACREYKRIDVEKMGERNVTIIKDSQRFKGETRCDLYILDADADVRLVVKM